MIDHLFDCLSDLFVVVGFGVVVLCVCVCVLGAVLLLLLPGFVGRLKNWKRFGEN